MSFAAALDAIGGWVAEGTLARAAAVVLHRGAVAAERRWGDAADGAPLDADTLFPVASLTKPAVATAVLRLVERGELSLRLTIGEAIPDAPASTRAITVAQLLTHTGGFPEHVPGVGALEARMAPVEAYVRAALDGAPLFPPGTRVLYSNPGFQVLGAMLERATGAAVADLIERETLAPAGMTGSTLRPLARAGARTARVVLVRPHPSPRTEIYNSPYFKRLARADAGLFAPLRDVARLMELYRLGGDGVLRPETALDALTSKTAGVPGRYGPYEWESCDFGWGWELRAGKSPHPTGARTSGRTFGHIGGAGVLAFCDPERALTVVLHCCRDFSDGWAKNRPYLTRVAGALVEASEE
jgi:beta-lactamase class C